MYLLGIRGKFTKYVIVVRETYLSFVNTKETTGNLGHAPPWK